VTLGFCNKAGNSCILNTLLGLAPLTKPNAVPDAPPLPQQVLSPVDHQAEYLAKTYSS